MGSSPWKTVTSYEPNVANALARAQDEVFERGEYGFAYKMKSLRSAIGEPVPEMPTEPVARTIDEAREIGAESGTSSILDIYEVDQEIGRAHV